MSKINLLPKFTPEEKNNKENFYWKLLHFKLFGTFYFLKYDDMSKRQKEYMEMTDHHMKMMDRHALSIKKCDIVSRVNDYDLKEDKDYMDKFYNVNSDDYLIKDDFPFTGEKAFVKLWNYIAQDKNIILAGGYMTSIVFNVDLLPEQDIDLFVNRSSIEGLVMFIKDNFNVIGYELIHQDVMNILLQDMRPIQIIVVEFEKISHVLDLFDMCHSKCAYYLGSTYYTYDAKYSKDTKRTISFQNIRDDRSDKCGRYGLSIFNKSLDPVTVKKTVIRVDYEDPKYNVNSSYVVRYSNTFNPDMIKKLTTKEKKKEKREESQTDWYLPTWYNYSDKILYEEIDIESEDIDPSEIFIKPTRYNYRHYGNMYKMVEYNEYFKVPCILHFTTTIEPKSLTVIGSHDFEIELRHPINHKLDNFMSKFKTEPIEPCSESIIMNDVYSNVSHLEIGSTYKTCLIFSVNDGQIVENESSLLHGFYINLYPDSAGY